MGGLLHLLMQVLLHHDTFGWHVLLHELTLGELEGNVLVFPAAGVGVGQSGEGALATALER